MPVRTIIVDDERYARLKLHDFLEHELDGEIVDEARSGQEVIQAIKKMKLDLFFSRCSNAGLGGVSGAGVR